MHAEGTRGIVRGPLALLAVAMLAGCLGSDKIFPDESGQVRSLHVNAYAEVGAAAPRPAIVEVSGFGPDGQERAFRGHVRVTIEKALHPEADVEYERVKEYDADVTAPDFSSRTVPYWKLVVPAADLPAEATYRASATAAIPGHAAPLSASALFAYSR
jgi:hypothetical protein